LLKELVLKANRKDSTMDQYEVEQLVSNLTRSIEELTYRIYTMEDSLAQINAQVEELKELQLEEEDA
jgi:TolA-binding protein